jgi:hypothetical protein
MPSDRSLQPDGVSSRRRSEIADESQPSPWGLDRGPGHSSAANSFTDGEHQSFHFTNEGWFGRHAYADGADKASHFVMYASRLNSSPSALMARMPALTVVALIAVCVIRAVS